MVVVTVISIAHLITTEANIGLLPIMLWKWAAGGQESSHRSVGKGNTNEVPPTYLKVLGMGK